ncbi:hypothetical protein DCC81_03780 [Chitinophaga parva]|uniref:Uncharacterized protein n=1 Tax=Chitinophaga parva TaxID=2169414 RepID=A0A2T7BLQ5_9BACT|nr:plasmid mobilization relaxosome protein MobC [Chitinophaga parva]PUZ28613.1 hypothetical protein DCC81_03780 [Chitinophaga parva]
MQKATKQKELLVHDVKTRISEKEFARLSSLIGQTRYRNMSELLRALLAKEPVTVYTKDGSLAVVMEELVLLRRELSAIGNNLNQVTRHLNSLKGQPGKAALLLQADATISQVQRQLEKIYPLISQLALKWLQK